MFLIFGKKKEKELIKTGTELCINESLLKTKDSEIIRCLNVAAHFNTKDEEQTKLVTHDMIRQCMIRIGYVVDLDTAINQKAKFEEEVNTEINRVIANLPFLCDTFTIENISKVEQRR